ncbi:C40 family peptidase [Actinomycetospora cinnamomea]|uniref:Cell wall-associated NlpC family hydrolase n=1 Tax=Actinomycetospora cinnamomea TaxID=663609 RepID=A0A2U1FQS9_9PSEU|nr:C40 family peptidase [Actinomycetospora cinnamomea]PVZ14538.1 cell wall-associated NlpC family hydrolase [Actinomycetospora cinnamomea]
MTAVLPETDPVSKQAPAPRPGGRHRAPEAATAGSMGVVPVDRRSRSAHGRHGRPAGHGEPPHPWGRAARTAGLSLAALGAVATAGGMATHGLLGDEAAPVTGETAISPELASANLALAPAAPALDAATTSVLPVVASSPASGVSSIKHDSPDSRAAARTTQQDQERSSEASSSGSDGEEVSSAGSSVAQQAIAAARSQLGVPYVWGGTSPSGFDCSGLTQWAFEKAGVELPRTSRAQAQAGEDVDLDNLQPGDLIFFNSPVSHVGMYIGDGQMIEAPQSGKDVRVASVARRMDDAVGARRFA